MHKCETCGAVGKEGSTIVCKCYVTSSIDFSALPTFVSNDELMIVKGLEPWIEHRLEICRECPHYKVIHSHEHCGHLLSLGKGSFIWGNKGVRSASAKCPIDKWIEFTQSDYKKYRNVPKKLTKN